MSGLPDIRPEDLVDAISPGRCRVHVDYYYADAGEATRQRRTLNEVER